MKNGKVFYINVSMIIGDPFVPERIIHLIVLLNWLDLLDTGDISRFWSLLFLIFLPSTTFKLFGFQIFWLWSYMMKVTPETCRAH